MENNKLIEEAKQFAQKRKTQSLYACCTIGDIEIDFDLERCVIPLEDEELGTCAYFLYYFDKEENFVDYEFMSEDEYLSEQSW